MGNKVSIKGIDKAELLAALYNASKCLGMGRLHYDPTVMTKEMAQQMIDKTTDDVGFPRRGDKLSFDYLKGRVMKVDLSGDELETFGYNRDNGEGAAEKIVANLSPN